MRHTHLIYPVSQTLNQIHKGEENKEQQFHCLDHLSKISAAAVKRRKKNNT
jgi:hypothetical protein